MGHTLCSTISMPGPCGIEGYKDVTSKLTKKRSGESCRSRPSRWLTTSTLFLTILSDISYKIMANYSCDIMHVFSCKILYDISYKILQELPCKITKEFGTYPGVILPYLYVRSWKNFLAISCIIF